jgi:alpha-D-ribose 1-methylphosphonate 5-phosphate C-P lyase
MPEPASDCTDRGEGRLGLESFDLKGSKTSGRAVVSSWVGNGDVLKVLDDGRDSSRAVVSSWVGNGDGLKALDDGRDKESE